MGLFSNKIGLVMGVANDHSIAWAMSEALYAEGAELGFTHLPSPSGERPGSSSRTSTRRTPARRWGATAATIRASPASGSGAPCRRASARYQEQPRAAIGQISRAMPSRQTQYQS